MNRRVEPELLDTLPPDDARAVHSRRDLRRINWWMGNAGIMARALGKIPPSATRKITELGAGDGEFLLRVARRMSPRWPDARTTLLDLQPNISGHTLAAFSKLGWRAEAVVADVHGWSPEAGVEQVVVTNLFLHHFQDEQLVGLLRKISGVATHFIAIEPQRFAPASLVKPLLRVIGCNEVTRHDAAVSIRAGFAGGELTALWPDSENWQLTERRAGLFSHLFIAQRRK